LGGGSYANRLVNLGGGFWHYDGGGAVDAELFWPGGSTGKWEFQHPGNGVWHCASNARTMPSIYTC
jgi:hypothetical protein